MVQGERKKAHLKLATPQSEEEIRLTKAGERRAHFRQFVSWSASLILLGMMSVGTYLVLVNQSFDNARTLMVHGRITTDVNSYEYFTGGFVQYNRDGISFLNRRNEEQWFHLKPMNSPITGRTEDIFVVADAGGDTISVFNRHGLRGEIATSHGVERLSVSDQGIVSAILRNEQEPMILTYDLVGNVLVENQLMASVHGYPIGLQMSPDGVVLGVSYVFLEAGVPSTRVIFYNFGPIGEGLMNRQVSEEVFLDTLVAELHFMNDDTIVAVSDRSLIFYRGHQVPEREMEIALEQEIRNVFHSQRYVGIVLLNEQRTGYKVRLFDTAGEEILAQEFPGTYSEVRMFGNEIIMHDGMNVSIVNTAGIVRFRGSLDVDVNFMAPARGINSYYVICDDAMRVIHLTW